MTTTSPSLNYPSRLLNMDPPLPPPPTTIVNPNSSATAIGNATIQISYADSTCSSPRSQQTDNWDDPLPQVPGAKLRLMCSFGGHIIPKPHDKTLCYVGGETRIVVVDRNSSLSDVHTRLSRSLLSGHGFTMKYQLPNEELDSLISVTTDEDMENMIEEYDRIMSTAIAKPARIRLFLFLAKPETTASMGALLDDAKSETWFVDALNNSDLLNRGVSDSAVMDNLLEFDGMVQNDSCTNLEGQADGMRGNNQEIKVADQEVHTSTQDSPMVETNSPFDSGLSSPPKDNLPPVKVKVNEKTPGLDEQFSQMNVETNGVNVSAVPRDNAGRIISDDDRSDKSIPVALRKPPLPLQPVQRKFTDPYNLPSPDSKQGSANNLQSPDSVASENSFTSAASIAKQSDNQDQSSAEIQDNRIFTHAADHRNNTTYPSSQIHFQQAQEPAVVPSLQQNPQQQQQFIQAPAQYTQHPGTGVMQVPSYYPMYGAAPTTQQQFHQQQMDQQYPVYLMPVNRAHQYNSPQQPLVADATVASSVRQPNQAAVPETDAEVLRTVQGSTPTYVHVPPNHFQQQYYGVSHVQTQRQPISTETDGEVNRTVQAPTPTYVQVAPNQFQQQYYGVSQVHPHAQNTSSSHAATANYSYNYTHPPHEQLNYVQHPPPIPTQYQTFTPDPSHDQLNYVQHPPPISIPSQYQTITPNPPHDQLTYGQHPQSTPIPSQYQTITPATALLISQATSQLAADNASQQIQNSQPK
ncbi:hypothetical protein Leryth_025458 [Lithospermum erythrorhizon]|nr:hypothetical protein Leryth_025458 [Lithospermum erythrorhizon]